MAELLDLPDELLLTIANVVQGNTKTAEKAYRNLKWLALSCRRLRPIAQEALHLEVVICRTQSLRGLNNLTCLVRTLIQRPGLALKVKKLDLGIIGNPVTHSRECEKLMCTEAEGCTCGFEPVLSLCIKTLGTAKTNNGLALYNHDWASNIQAGLQLAIVGLILCITPYLESLTLDYRMQKLHHSNFYTKPIAFEHISLNELFGSANQFPGFSIESIKGFTKLTRLTTNTFPPSKLLCLPQLTDLELGLLDDHCDDAPAYIKPSFNSTNTTLSTTLTHLAVRLDKLALYCDEVRVMHGIYSHLKHTIKRLTSLEHLILQFGSEWGDRFHSYLGDLSEASYTYVSSELESLSLTHLALDVEDIGNNWYDKLDNYVEEIQPIISFVKLPKLRSITAPEEALFFPGDVETCVLPANIESIGIIGATYGTFRFIRHILHCQGEWPNLKSIKLETGDYPPELWNNNDRDADENEEVEEIIHLLCDGKCEYDDEYDHYYCLNDWHGDERQWRLFFEHDRAVFQGSLDRDVRVEIVKEKLAWRKEWTG